MKSFLTVLAVILFAVCARLISSDNGTVRLPTSVHSNHTRYAILDNDWGSTAFIPFLLALAAGMEVLGLASDTADTWVGQTTLHGVSLRICSRRSRKGSKCLNEDLARHSRERKPVLHSGGKRRDLPLDTNVSAFPAMATALGKSRMARCIRSAKLDEAIFGKRSDRRRSYPDIQLRLHRRLPKHDRSRRV